MKQKPKMLPHSMEAEQAVLACVLIDEEAPLTILSLLQPEDFYSESHKIIFENMNRLNIDGQPIDFVTLVNKLESVGKLAEVGGLDYITTLTNTLPSAVNFKHYVEIVKNHSRLRQLILAGQHITEKAYEDVDGLEVLAYAEKQIFDIGEKEDTSSLEHIEKGLKAVMNKFEMLAKDKNALKGIPTGFAQFDQITNGLQNSDLILLAARPGFGKTSLAMNMLNYAAINHGKSCAIFSLEMPVTQLVQRSLCSVACVNMADALSGNLKDEEWNKIWVANKKLNDAKIYIDDSSINTPRDILSKCRRLKRERGLDIVMIDYLQLMKSGIKQDNRVLEIGEITRSLKIAAKELNVPIILLSQLSRSAESRKDHRPMLADLRDSGAIEQDADIVLFIYKPDMYNDVVNEDGEGICEIEIAKHRNGSLGKVKVRWVGEWVTFLDMNANYPKKQKPSSQINNSNSTDSSNNQGDGFNYNYDFNHINNNQTNEKQNEDYLTVENLASLEDEMNYTDADAPIQQEDNVFLGTNEELNELMNKFSSNDEDDKKE